MIAGLGLVSLTVYARRASAPCDGVVGRVKSMTRCAIIRRTDRRHDPAACGGAATLKPPPGKKAQKIGRFEAAKPSNRSRLNPAFQTTARSLGETLMPRNKLRSLLAATLALSASLAATARTPAISALQPTAPKSPPPTACRPARCLSWRLRRAIPSASLPAHKYHRSLSNSEV